MGLEIVSLIALLVAIAVGFVRKCNIGILCIGFSTLLGIIYGISAKEIISGFSSSLCIQMIGITYLFAVISNNGTLELLARKMVALVGKHRFLIPFVMYILGFVICAVGPGAIPTLAIIPVIAIPVAVSAGINPIMAALTITALVVVVLVYIYYKGWKVDETCGGTVGKLPAFSRIQWFSLAGLFVLAVGTLFFSWNVGLTGFMVGTALIVLGCGDESASFKAIPWSVIIMVLGVGILMNVISLSGGIDVLVAGLQSVMGERTAAMIMALAAGFMSFFSSGLGVVFPTLIPTAGGLASGIGVSAVELVAVIVIGGTVSGFTPISTTGALIMAGVAQQEDSGKKFPQNKLFVELFAVSFIALFVLAVFSLLGVYGLIV